MTADEFERAQEQRSVPWMPDHQLCIAYRNAVVTLGEPTKPAPGTPEAAAVYLSRAAIKRASWVSACDHKTRSRHGS